MGLQSLFTLHAGLDMQTVPVSSAPQFIPAPGSPVDEACKSLCNSVTVLVTLKKLTAVDMLTVH